MRKRLAAFASGRAEHFMRMARNAFDAGEPDEARHLIDLSIFWSDLELWLAGLIRFSAIGKRRRERKAGRITTEARWPS